jgi:imidazole glycerol-phosphate synthase subunit HisH
MSRVALIDYGSGNLHSAARALRAAGAVEVVITADPSEIARADRIVLPGVGHFADCAAGLAARPGLIDALNEAVITRARPFLGICVGQQLMARLGREDGDTPGLGWIDAVVEPITPGPGFRIPHMGWNALALRRAHPLLAGLGDDPHVYFTHSYAMRLNDPGDLAATAHYGEPITAAVARANLFGTQFHPEKSQATGLHLLSNFLAWSP